MRSARESGGAAGPAGGAAGKEAPTTHHRVHAAAVGGHAGHLNSNLRLPRERVEDVTGGEGVGVVTARGLAADGGVGDRCAIPDAATKLRQAGGGGGLGAAPGGEVGDGGEDLGRGAESEAEEGPRVPGEHAVDGAPGVQPERTTAGEAEELRFPRLQRTERGTGRLGLELAVEGGGEGIDDGGGEAMLQAAGVCALCAGGGHAHGGGGCGGCGGCGILRPSPTQAAAHQQAARPLAK